MIGIDTRLEKTVSLRSVDERWNTAHWYALYTRSRHEKLVDRELKKKGIESFLPLRKVTRHWSDRRKIIEDPLFKGYLFVHIPWRERWAVLNTVGVAHFVGPKASDPVQVPERDLWTIRRFMEQEIQLDPFPYLKEGQRVYIRSGLMKGAEGFIVRKDNHCRLVISLDLLMQSISVVIDEACVEPV